MAFLKAITSHVSCKSLSDHNLYGDACVGSRLELFEKACIRFLSHNHNADAKLYHIIVNIFNDLNLNIDKLHENVCTCLPYWYIDGIHNHTISYPGDQYFIHTCYDVDTDIIGEFMDLYPITSINTIIHCHIHSKEVFIRLLKKHMDSATTYEIEEVIKCIDPYNMSYIDIELLQKILDRLYILFNVDTNYSLFTLIGNVDRLFCSSIPLKDVFALSEEYWRNNPPHIRYIVQNPLLTFEDFKYIWNECHGELTSREYDELARYRSDVMLDYILKHDVEYDMGIFFWLSRSPTLTINDVTDNITRNWSWEELSINPAIATPENITKYPDLPWDWGTYGIAQSPGIDEDFIIQNMNKFHNARHGYRLLSTNHCITPKIMDMIPNLDYSYRGISRNNNVTLPFFFNKRKESWNLVTVIERIELCEEMAAKAIQGWWKLRNLMNKAKRLSNDVIDWYYHPDCKPAMKIRANRFYEQMTL